MEFIFLNAAGTTLFTRSDIEAGHWVQQEMNVTADFPFVAGKVIERGMRIAFRDFLDVLQVFEIRSVTNREPEHFQSIMAEHICISDLSDEHINKKEIDGKTAAEALAIALTGTLWAVGTNTASGTQSADFSRGSAWDAVNVIKQNWNVYIEPRVEISDAGAIIGRYLDIKPAGGTWRGVRLSIHKNMADPVVTYNDEDVLTALYGYGGDVGKSHQEGDDTIEELTFADEVWTATDEHPAKPSGQIYLEWPEKTALYGRNGRPRYGYYQNADITDAGVLLEKTWEALKQTCDPKISISGTVVDLYRLGYKDQPIMLHDTAIVDIEETGESFRKEIICLDVDLVDPSNTRPDIGDYIPNIIYINRNANKKGGGGGGRGQTNDEDQGLRFESEFIRTSQMIGMVVGLKDGDTYIKAASIIASINDDAGTNIKLTADTIDIEGLLTAFETEAITCGDLTCGGSVDVDQDIQAGGTVSGLAGSFDNIYVADDQATWQSTSVITGVTVNSTASHTWAGTNGTIVYTGSLVTSVSKSSSTLHYLGSATT